MNIWRNSDFATSKETATSSRRQVVCTVLAFKKSTYNTPFGLKGLPNANAGIFRMTYWVYYLPLQTDMGIKNLPADSAERLAGSDADYSNRKLYNTISNGKYVSIQSHVCSPSCLFTLFIFVIVRMIICICTVINFTGKNEYFFSFLSPLGQCTFKWWRLTRQKNPLLIHLIWPR